MVTLNVGATNPREGAVVAYVEQLDADVIVFQEAGVSFAPYAPVVARVLASGRYTVHVDSTAGTDGAGRQVTLSRLPVVSYESGYLAAPEPRSGVYGRTVVQWEGQEVAVYNVHLRPFNPEVGWSWERTLDPAIWAETPGNLRDFFAEHAIEADALARRIEGETVPVIVAGDFNASPDQWSRATLSSTLREVTGRWLPAATRPDETPVVNVDGILVSRDWAVTEASVGPSGLSDHRAVTAALTQAD
ncbi:endonuclease/exonuclease/phosphatase family protein [Rubrivirga sp.]|uniref:endonuclease/exonuclease/phosphatase family protein n=1 Tax=Rubrivirga sp. TaxID=1885344 RepID=UPI003C7291BF